MKKLLFFIVGVLVLTSCCENRDLVLNGTNRTFEYYGLFDKNEIKNDSINYELKTESVVCAILFSQSVIPPLYIIGYNLYEPTNVKAQFREPSLKTQIENAEKGLH